MARFFFKLSFIIILLCFFVFFYRQLNFALVEYVTGTEGDWHFFRAKPINYNRVDKIEITEGTTYGSLMASTSLSYENYMAIYAASEPVYNLVKIRAGRFIELTVDKRTEEVNEFRYKIDSEDELIVKKYFSIENIPGIATGTIGVSSTTAAVWAARLAPIPYKMKRRTAAGTVEFSMYQTALDNNFDIRAIIELANAFQWTIDFAMDPRVGDTFKFYYEERYLDGEYIMPGSILAGRYVNDGTSYEVYYFEEDEENKGYFDQDGNSVQKIFLRAPVSYKYISSGYTGGHRYVGGQYQMFTSSHKAIDYAANYGAPIRAVGDGTVTRAGWNGNYGNFTSIRHNGTFSTNYAHQSKIIVSRGQKVKQGEVIGYVGSSGFSTGPHLHYEMVKNGVKVNPLREVLPPGKPIKDENKERFVDAVEFLRERLGQ